MGLPWRHRELLTTALTDIGLQLVGLSVKLGRSSLTSIERSFSGTPSRIFGKGSLTTRPWAVSGST